MKLVFNLFCIGILGLFACKPPAQSKLYEGAGQKIYQQNCASCHQLDGKGLAGAFPPLDGSEWVKTDKGRLIRIVLDGFSGEITRNGQKYNQLMSGLGHLSNQEIADVLTFTRKSWSNLATEVTPAEVALVRKFTEQRQTPWTEKELLDLKNQGIPSVSYLSP